MMTKPDVAVPADDLSTDARHAAADLMPQWREYDLDAALKAARENGRLLLVFWTADWCPPCQEFKLRVFHQRVFAERASDLVLLTINGDAPGAQNLADRLQVLNYPTVLLLDGDGAERIRFPGGITVEQFCHLLDLASDNASGIGNLIEQATRDIDLKKSEYELLAYHWWGADDRHARGEARAPFLLKLFHACPPDLVPSRLRLLIHWLVARQRHDSPSADIGEKQTIELLSFLNSAMQSRTVDFSSLYFLIVDLSVLKYLAEPGTPARAQLHRTLSHSVERVLDTPGVSTTEQLIALMAALRLALAMSDEKVTNADHLERIRKAVADAATTSTTVAERQTAMNMAGHLLKAAGDVGAAKAVFLGEIERSPHPTYFMPYVADICLEQGETDEALRWWRQAYEMTPVSATRFNLGVRFVLKLFELYPGRRESIEHEVVRVLSDIASATDAQAGLNRVAMGRLLAGLAGWRSRLSAQQT